MNQYLKPDLIEGLSEEGKTDVEIAYFLGQSLHKVREITNPNYKSRMLEVLETKRIKREHKARPPVRVNEFITPHEQGQRLVGEPQGTFLASQEGREALERINRRYEPSMPEIHSLKKGDLDGKPSLFHDAGWGERKARGLV